MIIIFHSLHNKQFILMFFRLITRFLHLRLLLLICFFALGFQSQVVRGQAPDPRLRAHLIKTNVLSLVGRGTAVYYERALLRHQSFQFGAFVGLHGSPLVRGEFYRIFTLTPEWRFYRGGHQLAPNGFYLAPYLKYKRISYGEGWTSPGFGGVARALGGGLAIGRQWVFQQGFTMDAFFGGGYYPAYQAGNIFKSTPFHGNENHFKGDIRLGFALGYAF
ncbi:hypothetical protein BH24BAC1_BH24BAC1_38630 [soil metagenome]